MTVLVAGAQARSLEERILLRHVKPTEVAERLDLLTGAALGLDPPHLKLLPDDATRTLLVTIPSAAGGEMEQQRMRLIIRDYIAQIDQPEPKILVHMYIVRPSLLSEADFEALDGALRRGPLPLPPGATSKGVLYWNRLEAQDQQVIKLAEEKIPAAEAALLGTLRLTGRLMPAYREDGRVAVQVELVAETERGALAAGRNRVELRGRAAEADQQPLIMVAGPQQRGGDTARATPRHELMVYLWAAPERAAAGPRR